MIKNVIFDLGRVLIEYEPYEYVKSLGYEDAKAAGLMRAIFNSPVWTELDRGTVRFAEAIDKMCENAPALAGDIRNVMGENKFDFFTVKEKSRQFFIELKNAGYSLYFLSNYPEEGFAYAKEKFDFLSMADGMVISAHVKMIKPDREIYEHILTKYALEPEETVFIDDLPVNVKAAEAVGIRTILFTDVDSCRAQFEQLLK